jgi:hypothetical protein
MSYDLMVFEPEAAPKDHVEFMTWYFTQTKWGEGHSYGDPAVCSKRLRAWFEDMIRTFPPLNGVFAEEELPADEASASDYSVGKEMIYIAFAWSKADLAYKTTFELAAKHGLGFFNVSSGEQEVWLPGAGALVLAHRKGPPSLSARIRSFFSGRKSSGG